MAFRPRNWFGPPRAISVPPLPQMKRTAKTFQPFRSLALTKWLSTAMGCLMFEVFVVSKISFPFIQACIHQLPPMPRVTSRSSGD